jgi:nucleotide-binding universal stress UspA family protein
MSLIVIAYDGSPGAEAAIDVAARLFPDSRAVVVTSWRSVRASARAARVSLSDGMIEDAVHKLDSAAEQAAIDLASAGADRARELGLDAGAKAVCGLPSAAAAIGGAAAELDASAVVVGARRHSALAAAVLGSVCTALVHHCERPVVVVHPTRRDE